MTLSYFTTENRRTETASTAAQARAATAAIWARAAERAAAAAEAEAEEEGAMVPSLFPRKMKKERKKKVKSTRKSERAKEKLSTSFLSFSLSLLSLFSLSDHHHFSFFPFHRTIKALFCCCFSSSFQTQKE